MNELDQLRVEFEEYRKQKDLELESLQNRVYDLEEKRKKRAKKDIEYAVDLQEIKDDFVNSRPEDRLDPFTDEELVLWFTFIKVKNNPKELERITTFSELYKRVKKIKLVLEHFKEAEKYTGFTEEELDQYTRLKAKNYLEYMIRAEKLPENKQNEFYFVTSQYALNTYGNNVASWQRIKQLDDTPLE